MNTLESYPEVSYEIVEMDSHRNGVGGAPFVVTLLDAVIEGEKSRFLCTSFFGSNEHYSPKDFFATNTSAIDVLRLDDCGIAFAQGNSWKGADMFGKVIADEWQRRCREGEKYEWLKYDPFDDDWTAD